MAQFIFAGPANGPRTVRIDRWVGLSVTWTGPDGSVWDLADVAGGVFLDRAGVEGLHFPPITKYRSAARGIPGNRVRGWRTEAREVFWPIHLWGGSSEEWLTRNEAFLSTIHPERAGTWTVQASGRPARSLQLTGVFDESHAYTVDPVHSGWASYGITLEASQPYWEGELITRGPWKAPDPVPFFPGPPFSIGRGAAFGTAVIPNPGDVEGWGVWRAVGPLSSVELGVGDAIIEVPFDVPSGEVLVIDTDPRHPTARMGAVPDEGEVFDGADMRSQLGLQDYAPVPVGSSVPLHVDATGTGEITYELKPLFFRAI